MSTHRPAFWVAVCGLLVVLIYAIRLAGPLDYEADAQDRNVGYVMDAVWQGHWLVQTDIRARVMSKPPLHTWLAAGFASIGGINRLTLSLPAALAVLGMTLLVFEVGRRRFGLLAGGLAALAVILAPMMSRHIVLVRSDALFSLTIALAAFAAYRAWEHKGSWLPFWFAVTLATLTKGPLGILLAAAGLLAWFWERRDTPSLPPPRGQHGSGIALLLCLTLGWLLLAYLNYGPKLIDRMIFGELLGHATGMNKGAIPGENLYKPALFFTLRFLPFSLFAWLGLWRILRHPAADPAERRFERFLFCWIAVGLLVFGLAAHFRADLLLPLWPAAALLAGRELARLGTRLGLRRFAVLTTTVAVLIIGAIAWNTLGPRQGHASKEERYTLQAVRNAHALLASGLDVATILHLDTPTTLQLTLRTFNTWIEEEDALALLRTGEPVLLAVEDQKDYPKLFGPGGPSLHTVFAAPGLTVYANAARP